MDACERLTQLGLTEIQQREIVRVILHCCGNVRLFSVVHLLHPDPFIQEKAYNPYYTFIFQHLCRSSHSYKVTLQFCLWDFLRDLGETNVGGAEVIKSLKDEDGLSGGFGVKSVSATRSRNVALAYAWLIAKDAITLAVLKVCRPFTLLIQLCSRGEPACRLYRHQTTDPYIPPRVLHGTLPQHSIFTACSQSKT